MDDWPLHVNVFCQIFGGFPLKCTVRPDGKKQFCSSSTSQLWSVTLLSFQFFVSMISGYRLCEMLIMGLKLSHIEHKLFMLFVFVKDISITTMILVLFFSYNRKQIRFVRIHYDLDMIDRNLKLTTTRTNVTMEMVVTCIVVTALLSISTLLLIINYQNKNVSFQEQQLTIIIYVCKGSMFWAQGVFFVHFSHITQGIAARFMNATYEMEEVAVGNNFRSLVPYQILVSGISCGKE
ncbi:hypothetical protein J6590_095112 [Homalodisca vitripennis]|nr:hypothetical protein J6590_095112 [Homalodisca vitripennis]